MGSACVLRAFVSRPGHVFVPPSGSAWLVERGWNDEVSDGTPETTRRRRVLPLPIESAWPSPAIQGAAFTTMTSRTRAATKSARRALPAAFMWRDGVM